MKCSPFFSFFLSLVGSLSALITREAALGTTSIFACLFCTINLTVTFNPFQSWVAFAISSPTFFGDYTIEMWKHKESKTSKTCTWNSSNIMQNDTCTAYKSQRSNLWCKRRSSTNHSTNSPKVYWCVLIQQTHYNVSYNYTYHDYIHLRWYITQVISFLVRFYLVNYLGE